MEHPWSFSVHDFIFSLFIKSLSLLIMIKAEFTLYKTDIHILDILLSIDLKKNNSLIFQIKLTKFLNEVNNIQELKKK